MAICVRFKYLSGKQDNHRTKKSHFDQREKSAVCPRTAASRFLTLVEMTVIAWCTHHLELRIGDIRYVGYPLHVRKVLF